MTQWEIVNDKTGESRLIDEPQEGSEKPPALLAT